MADPVEIYRGVPVFYTADLTLVVPPSQFALACVLRESDEGPVLTMEANLDDMHQQIDDWLGEEAA